MSPRVRCLRAVSAFASTCALACGSADDPTSSPDCTNSSLDIQVTEPTTDSVVSGDVVIRGRVVQEQGLAVHYVRVGGLDVTKKGFNFETWEASVGLGSLKAIDPIAPTLIVEAEDTCGNKSTADVRLQLKLPVTGLAVAVTYPNGAFAPATKPIPAAITVTAAPSSKGGGFEISAPPGWSLLAPPPGGEGVLAGDGVKVSSAMLFATCSPMAALVLSQLTVRSGDSDASAFLRCAGPATFVASSFSLKPAGAALVVEVVSSGDVAGCQSTAVPGVSAVSGSVNLAGGTVVKDNTGNGQADFTVVADTTATVGASLSVSCWDSYLQTTQAVFQVIAP